MAYNFATVQWKWYQKKKKWLIFKKNISSANVREQLTAAPAIFPCGILPTGEQCLELHMS
jgi:hypothetical protein